MKKLLLKIAYGILRLYKEAPTSVELGNVILIRGNRYVVTDYDITINRYECDKVTIRAKAWWEVLKDGRDR